MEDQIDKVDLYRQFAVVSSDEICWKKLEPLQLKIISNVMRNYKTRASIKEMITDEIKYASEHKDEVGMFRYEWQYVVDRLTEKLQAKRIQNREEIEHLIKILTIFIKKGI